ncbi:MAG TPA: NADH-ubiquinone dehydrogenase [Mesorhizobium sp.]|jgi:NADH-quinone oxidoreductase subunit E|uniref:NADH-ubiquinone dehydrogenase n=1 Tax=Mesorhizobium sp. TaxID=1871066 RepID=UPI002DDCA8FE|nr:NADH-ubiquinone dehydrogenase [Mesorhizobium sp.]HEV2504695.1 NADH-ubiquinone dehydrogenase [Mesorhizobium sp.]
MSMFPIPDTVPDRNEFEKMTQDLTRMMPQEMASAVNLFAHPVAGAAAFSALGFGLASHAFGVWVGALTGAAEMSQRLMQPVLDDFPGSGTSFADRDGAPAAKAPAARARIATKKLIAEVQSVAEQVAEPVVEMTEDIQPTETAVVEVPAAVVVAALQPEDFRKPASIHKPVAPDDLKAITGVGPKLEKVLNDLGVWTYAQVAAWTPAEVAWVDDYLGFKGRVERDGWLTQAAAFTAKTKN